MWRQGIWLVLVQHLGCSPHHRYCAGILLQEAPLGIGAGATADYHLQGAMEVPLRAGPGAPDGADQLRLPDAGAAEAACGAAAQMPQGGYQGDGSVAGGGEI